MASISRMQPRHYENPEDFAAVCEDLSHYGEKGHEVVKFSNSTLVD